MVLSVSAEAADAVHKEAHGLGADEDSAGDGQTGHGRSRLAEAFADGSLTLPGMGIKRRPLLGNLVNKVGTA